MPAEVAENSQPTAAVVRADSAMASEAQNTWAPGANSFKLGAVFNDTYNQSLATQYDDLGQRAIDGVGNGVQAMLVVGEFGFQLVSDGAQVAAADLQIGYEKMTYPALAEANSDVLAQHIRELGAQYEPAIEPLKQGYDYMERDLEDIGAQSNTDSKAYLRLVTDPASNIASATDKFTSQSPGAQVEAYTDQATQIAALGLTEKLLGGAVGLTAAGFTAKYEALLATMDADLSKFGLDSLGRQVAALGPDGVRAGEISKLTDTAKPQDNILMMKGKSHDFVKNLDGLDRVEDIRREFRVGNGKNIAYAEFELNGTKQDLVAISGQKSPGHTVGLPTERKFEAESQGFELRDDHSEVKLLEKIAETLDKSIKERGTLPDLSIKLFTEREPCPSCEKMILEFEKRYGGKVKINVEYGLDR